MKNWIFPCFLILTIWLNGCGKAEIQVVEVDSKTVSSAETIHMNNCGGKDSSEQTPQRSFAISLELSPKAQAEYKAVEQVVAGKYGQYREMTKSQLLKAPAGTDMEFALNWSEQVYSGAVVFNGEAGKYIVRVPLAVELASSRDLGCPTSATVTPQMDTAQTGPETLRVEFKNGNNGVSTVRSYSGQVTILVQGTGRASASQWSDAFYVFTDFNGNAVEPYHPKDFYNFSLWINGEPVDTLVNPIPSYNPEHVYEFVLKAPGGKLVFAIGDAYTVDNEGYLMVTISK